MKKLFIAAIILSILTPSCKTSQIRGIRVRIDGDELPGIGGTQQHPDTCIAWYDKRRKAVILRYKDTLVLGVAKCTTCVPAEEPLPDIRKNQKHEK